jgi:hypothetical protein
MKIACLLRRTTRRFVSWIRADRGNSRVDLTDTETDAPFPIMSDKEFAEYLRLHTKSHRWKV